MYEEILLQFFRSSRFILGLDKILSALPDCFTGADSLLVKTGLSVEIPIGYEIQVRPRSGLALSKGITVLNSPGTIDADYRGEIGVILINHGKEQVFLQKGERIGQLVMNKVERIEWNPVTSLTGTKRGEHGFGSTGNK